MTTPVFCFQKITPILLIYLFIGQSIDAQVSFDGIPIRVESVQSVEPLKISWDENRFRIVSKSESALPLAGVTIRAEADLVTHGKWIVDIKQRAKVWQLELLPTEIEEFSLYFSRFNPGEMGQFFVLTASGELIAGAFTRQSHPQEGPFAIGPLPAKPVILQFQTAMDADDYAIVLNEVGLLKSVSSQQGFGTSGNCEVNVNCSEGSRWQKQKRGVARIVVKHGAALYYCSGSLVNNVREDHTPYFLTANHCGAQSSANDYAQWLFAFNYEAEGCARPATEPAKNSMSGATRLASTSGSVADNSDFKLLRLLQDVPESYQPYYNGWSRSSAAASSGVGIHHPDGDIKKISTFNTTVVSSEYSMGGTFPNGKYWRLGWAATENGFGVTEGGSSGSPLFNDNGLIVGTLTGGTTSCDDTDGVDFYGKFSYSWASNGATPEAQLAPWLDPDESGVEAIGGLDSDPYFVLSAFEAKRNDLSINQFVEFDNQSSGRINTYQWVFEGGKPASSNAQKPGPVLYENYGNYDVTLVVANEQRTDTLSKKDYISVKPFLFPNPVNQNFTLAFGTDITDKIELDLFDAMGRPAPFGFKIQGSRIFISMAEAPAGNYVIVIRDQAIEKALKFSVVR
ncbi:T9SS type A sorting domain-containing protein [Bacteroidales bacterium]